MRVLQRLLSILLLLVFGLPYASPLLAADSDARLPVCCRRGGVHHCEAMADMDGPAGATHVGSLSPKCPFAPSAVTAVAFRPLAMLAPVSYVFATLLSHPAGVPQTESRARMSCSRTRQKRGPPSFETPLNRS